MSSAPTPRHHALGLPAGSIRALLGLGVLGMLWAMALTQPEKLPPAFIYLLFLMMVILVHYFAAHGKTLGKGVSERGALGLPRGSIRLALMGGFVALLVWMWRHSAKIEVLDGDKLFALIALLLAGFLAGYMVSVVFRTANGELPDWLQNVQAWAALVAVLGLGVLVMVYAVINPGLKVSAPIDVDYVETALAALIGFYFGARS